MNIASDHQARIQALDISQSFIVQAPAGSGKTELLSRRILKLLAHSEVPENILAITFTRKAASEMRARIISALEQAATLKHRFSESELAQHLTTLNEHERSGLTLALQALEHSQAMNWHLLENPNRLQLKTIDSFCGQLAFQLPVLSELGGSSQIYDNAEEIFSEASRNFMATLEENQSWSPALARVLRYFDKRSEQLENMFTDLLHKRLQWAPIVMQFRERLQQNSLQFMKEEVEFCLREMVTRHIHLLKEHTFYAHLKHTINALQPFLTEHIASDKALKQLARIDEPETVDEKFLANLKLVKALLLTQGNTIRKKVDVSIGFPADKKEPFASHKQRMQNLLAELENHSGLVELLANIDILPPLEIDENDIQISADICECLYVLLGYLQLGFQSHQALDFSEVQLKALHVLNPDTHGENTVSHALLSINTRIQHILVDEYQDTSLVQLRLLKYLTADWHYQQDGRSLFLVGDPMQSIYRFREAEVAIFLEAQQQGLEQIHLQNLVLTCNFRSGTQLVDWFNQHFKSAFPQHSDVQHGAVTYSPSEAFKNQLLSKVHCRIERIAVDDEESHDLQEANICKEILALKLDKPQETIAVLIQARTHVQTLIELFKQSGISYLAVEIDVLTEKPHINTLFNLSCALLNSFDDIAWFALLRSSLLGLDNASLLGFKNYLEQHALSAAQIFIHSDASLLKHYIDAADINSQQAEALTRFYQVMSNAYQHRHISGFSSCLEPAWLALGGPALIEHNQQEDCERYFSLIQKLEKNKQTLNSQLIKNNLSKLYARQVPEDDNPVQIMTIHKSKGLEFDHVFLPALHKTGASDTGNLLNWNIYHASNHQDYLLLAPQVPKYKKYTQPANSLSLYDFLSENNRQKARNEAIRLLYVACTRAKQQLFLYGAIKQKLEKQELVDQAPKTNSLLSLIYSQLNPETIEFLEQESSHTLYTQSHTPDYQLNRLAYTWKNLPELQYKAEQEKNEAQQHHPVHNHIHTIFEQDYASALGTLVHYGLQNLVEQKHARDIIQTLEHDPHYIKLAKNSGIFSETVLEKILSECKRILLKVAQPHHDDWIFDSQLEQSRCELNLMYLDHTGRLKQSFIDRTFIREGKRWIIDYKNSQPRDDQSLEAFFEQEKQKHAVQLQQYAELFKEMENLPQQLALYFPRLCRLLEN